MDTAKLGAQVNGSLKSISEFGLPILDLNRG
jgi:hypothetical protein